MRRRTVGLMIPLLGFIPAIFWRQGDVEKANAATAAALAPRPRFHPLQDVVSIVEADIVAAKNTYTETHGPRVEYTIGNVKVHAGAEPDRSTFSQFGGPLPEGGFVEISELPQIHPGSRYLLFLSHHNWFYTPIWAGQSFRVERIEGREIALTAEGTPVIGFDRHGPRGGRTKVVDVSGRVGMTDVRPIQNFDRNASDIVHGLGPADIALSAKEVIRELGGSLRPPASFRLSPRTGWRTHQATRAL